jgi:4-aminobutyrate aminotransferase/(S)-3-amino-2-methylpropionate transaminase
MTHKAIPSMITEVPGPKARAILQRQKKYLFFDLPTPLPIVWDSAEGSIVTDVDGNRYIDFSSGVLVMNAGHSHPLINEELTKQVGKVIHSYFAPTEPLVRGLEALASILPPTHQKILPVTTGAEAVEAAVKIARAYTKKTEVLTFFGGFHGRSYLTMAMGGLIGVKKGFGPMPTGHLHAPYPYCYRCPFGLERENCGIHCLSYLEDVLISTSCGDLAALVIEPYQGSSGVIIPPKEFVEGLRDFCDRHGMLLIFDEVQSSFGRTGKNFAFQHFSYVPDIICVGKGIANGIPTSAVIVREDISEALRSISWTSTFAANPLSWASVAASIDVLVEENLAEKAVRIGEYTHERLKDMKEKYSLIGDVRVMGLAIGIEFVKNRDNKEPAQNETMKIFMEATSSGMVLIPPIGVYGNVLRVAPPLSTPESLMDIGLSILEKSIKSIS